MINQLSFLIEKMLSVTLNNKMLMNQLYIYDIINIRRS